MNRSATHPFDLAVLAATAVFLALLGAASAQPAGSPSGEYGAVALGGSVEGTLAPVRGAETLVFHTYTVDLPAGTGPVTVRLEGDGSDLDLALELGAPIVDYTHVDFLDVSETLDPAHTLDASDGGVLYIDVLNLLPEPATYRLTVTRGADDAPSGSVPRAADPGTNPLAGGAAPAADPLLGNFEGDGLRVTVVGGDGDYRGELSLAGERYPFRADGGDGRLDGSFTSAGSSYPFRAVLAGDTLTVTSGGSSYTARRIGASAAPDAPANPLGGEAPSPAATDDPVVAQGPHGTLTRDDALAFLEALEFSLAQVGFTQRFGEAERQQLLQAIAQNYGTLEPSEQAVLAQAREVWTRVQGNWSAATPADREQFVLGVFVLAFGEQAVRQAMAQSGGDGSGDRGSSGGGAGCATVDDCVGRYADPGTYQDTMNAQGCWAAAGCSSYDAGSDTFTYDDYGTY